MNHKLYIFTVVYRQDAVWNRSPVRTYRRWLWTCTCGCWSGIDRPAGYRTWSRAGFHARAHYLINS